MLPVLVRMVPAVHTTGSPLTPAVAEDIIWATADSRDCLEHLAVEGETRLLSIMFFVRAQDSEQARDMVGQLMNRVLSGAGHLAGWRLHECASVDL
ncbi:hypothetical protein GCM10010211_85430 [Streptomyces albospinus]|uniref:Uncharacterized protein n=1 Tax=Streptomyces albospinus TaxID=285515 RepID=A0ABQ2VSV0_9ACTN|nr:hypothetical protein [Streptomyces albospinus]GGV05477.1 hypothetical protein GCM10010211_85430 [Streptomyces albospinus]